MINLPPIEIRPHEFMRIYANQFIDAHDAWVASRQKASPMEAPRLFCLCRALELAAKALHYHAGRTDAQVRKLSHNLLRCCDRALLGSYGVVLDGSEEQAVRLANDYYGHKGFEYPLYGEKPEQGVSRMLGGWPQLPDEAALRRLLERLLGVALG